MRKIMHATFAATLLGMASFGLASTTSISAYGATMEGATSGAGDTLTPKAIAVCDGPFILTPAAFAACQAKSFPDVIKDGSRYVNTGIGAEFNTLIRQLPTVTADDATVSATVSVPTAN